jgi:hypothetical protein
VTEIGNYSVVIASDSTLYLIPDFCFVSCLPALFLLSFTFVVFLFVADDLFYLTGPYSAPSQEPSSSTSVKSESKSESKSSGGGAGKSVTVALLSTIPLMSRAHLAMAMVALAMCMQEKDTVNVCACWFCMCCKMGCW